MNIISKLTMATFGATLAGVLFLGGPVNAQGTDAFSAGAPGMQSNQTPITGSQTDTVSAGQAPMLQGATNGTIGPQAG
ncbi:MAG: hypothetical protein HY711_02280, partial [Candidatus Melainabacteria bacterium]|nr:hypothetical protein [Candidatus Melainabacteria bacterium]